MKITITILALTAGAVIVALPISLQAKERKTFGTASPSPAASPAAHGEKAIPYRGKIAAVDEADKSFTLQGREKSRTIKVTDETKIEKSGGAPATWSDVKADEEVRGAYWKKADGSMVAKKVTLGPKTPEEIAAAEARKARKAAKAAAEAKPAP